MNSTGRSSQAAAATGLGLSRSSRMRAAALRYLSSTFAMAAGLLAHTIGLIVVARALGPEQFGRLAIITTVSSLGFAVCGLGGGEVLRRTVARDRAAYAGALGHALLLLVPSGLVLSLALSLALAGWVPLQATFGSSALVIFLLVFSNIALFAWGGLAEQILLAHEAIGLANLVNAASGILRAVAAVLACLVFGVNELAEWAVWHFAFYAISSAVGAAAVWRYGRPVFALQTQELANGATMSATSLLMILRQNADILAVSLVASPSVIGTYSLARRVLGTASVVSASLDRLVYSSLARAGRDGVAATLKLARRYAAYSFALCLGSTVAAFVGAPLLPLIFGEAYAGAVPYLRALSGLLILTGLHYLAFDALNACDRHKSRLLAEVVASIVGLAILVAMTATGELAGVILATYAAVAVVVAALWGTLWRLSRDETAVRAGGPK